MASSEVSMQEMSEVVIVTIPEAVGEDLPSVVEEDKAVLVTAELTPQPGEGILTVAPVEAEAETSRTDSLTREEAVIVKLTEEVDVEADVFYPITCGDAKATLVWKKFVCPGINVKCVQFNEQLISPKEFVCLAGKSTLKDWKRAIRLNGTMLRKIMDSGELDFYQHAKVCSNTCRSTKIDLVGTKVSISSDHSAELVPATPSSADLNGAAASFPEVSEETSEWVTAIGEDSVAFWRAVKEAGLLEEVMEDFQKELQEVLKGLQERVCDPPLQVKDAVLLNNIVQNFGMLDLVKKVLASHKSQMDRYREQYTRSLAALEQQCDEHRKRAKELKSKSQHLNNVLMTLTPVPAPPTPKRPRLTRAISGPASVSATSTQITLPLNQLSGLPLGKVLTVAGAPSATNLGGYTLLTSSLSGSELAADASNLTVLSTTAGQEGAAGGSTASTAFVKVVGPQFQLVTLPTALQSLATAQSGVQQQVGSISVVDATATVAEDSQEEGQADGEEECQPEQVKEQDGEQPAEQQ
ncbi:glucocorticoid modulatory element-binding protein 2 [Plectropomus leopardus]|uniref:glucocorticoid modulatory element-binding protein 2 n=1 Tax=Plectropomus leopardus TaxID=160734 RepID=UPI001C4AD775|nr:glucocorticoid modulatory element-binding protein 2 [Plectropomus leopardus]XP_042348638.1 glucocorticoid modulatory element-binding protein 2 [Plectropomus leopardus]XP_042348639.1 glucocorticoid modulatory element-binding protein 2 [Plectropomus leopardus]